MKKVFIFLLAFGALSSHAEWKYIDSASDGRFKIYYDPATIRRSGSIAKMWTLTDYAKPMTDRTGDTFSSAKYQSAYDCQDEKSSLLALIQFSGRMGKGNVVYSGVFDANKSSWKPVSPKSILEAEFQVACGQ